MSLPPDQTVADARRSEGRTHVARVEFGRRARDAGALRRDLDAAAWPLRSRSASARGGGYRLSEAPVCAGHPRHAPASPHRSSSRTRSSPSSRAAHGYRRLTDILARPERLPQVVRDELIAIREQYVRRAPHRDQPRSSRPVHRGPDRAAGRRRHAVTCGLCEVSAGHRVPDARRRGGRGKAATSVKDEDFIEKLFGAHARHDPVLQQSRQGLLETRLRTTAGRRGSRGKPMVTCSARRRREDQRHPADQAYDDDHFVFMQPARHRQEDAAVAFSRPPRQRASSA